MAHIEMLYRYPVKGLSPERLQSADLVNDQGFAGDREYALALPATKFDPDAPEPQSKTKFAVLVAHEKLAQLQSHLEPTSKRLTISEGGSQRASGQLDTMNGRVAIEDYFENFIGTEVGGRVRLVSAPGHRFTDVSVYSRDFMMAVSVVNLASVRALAGYMGVPLDPLRFRANIYIDGLPAGTELEWIDRPVILGSVACVGAKRTRRCAATNVDPVTAARNLDIPRALHTRYGHADLGIYIFVRGNGRIERGTEVTVA